ncbi:MAG: thiamine ABC transporter substrate-binding protein [Trueperella sp.]|nr:thiamine ABC transporter substrate-binding protein [Trueperella sp.]
MRKLLAIAAVSALALAGCSAADQKASGDNTITVLTHDSFNVPDELIKKFEGETGYQVKTTAPGDAGMVFTQLLLNKDAPQVDVVFGIDNFSAYTAVDEGLFEDYKPENDPGAEYRIGELSAIDFGDVCLNIDHSYFAEKGIPEPETYEDLVKPEYQNLTVTTNPTSSSPGLAFFVGSVAKFGDDGWQDYWKQLFANGVKVDQSWSDAFYTDFTKGDGKGEYPLVVSYASSPAYAAGEFGTVFGTCVRQVEYAGVIKGAKNPDGAKAFIDFMLSDEFQSIIPEEMYMYPVAAVELPAEWTQYAKLADDPIVPDAEKIAKNRESLLKEWTALFEARVGA